MRKRIGYVFGSFNPIHYGHISIATQALERKLVDEVHFVPAKQNPWKENSVDFGLRLKMIDEMVKNIPNVVSDDVERHVESPYTVDVLKYIRKNLNEGDIMSMITTNETLSDIIRWHKGDDILLRNQIHTVKMPIKIHSTDIRNMIKDGKKPLQEYINDGVWEIIKKEKLYGYGS